MNDVEEWPVANIEAQSSMSVTVMFNFSLLLIISHFYSIIQAFESITVALVTQENFTNLTVVTEDVVLIAQRVNLSFLMYCDVNKLKI